MNAYEGSLDTCDLTDLLLSLHASSGTGRLCLEHDGVTRELYLDRGRLVNAESSAETDTLPWLLFTAGIISDDAHRRIKSLVDGGARPCRALVESGGLSPAMLCQWIDRRTRFLTRDSLAWSTGSYAFQEHVGIPEGTVTVEVDVPELILRTLRDGIATGTFIPASPPAPDTYPEISGIGKARREDLLPHERYVLSLANGHRTVSEICDVSDIGVEETVRVLSILELARMIRTGREAPAARRGGKAAPDTGIAPNDVTPRERMTGLDAWIDSALPEGNNQADLRATIRLYNDVFVSVAAYMNKEIGPIAEQLLEKNLREVRQVNADLFQRLSASREGALPEESLMRNVNRMAESGRRSNLIAGLRDYLSAMLSVVRRMLGTEHETRVVTRFTESRCQKI